MKKTFKFQIYFLLLILVTTSTTSCKKEDDSLSNQESALVGKWSLKGVDEGSGLKPFNEYFVWELNSDGKGFSKYRQDGTGSLVTFSLIWEVSSDNILRISRDGGQDWQRERILKISSSELWTYDMDFDEGLRYIKVQ